MGHSIFRSQLSPKKEEELTVIMQSESAVQHSSQLLLKKTFF